MPRKTMTVRLDCTLVNGSEQWGPGDCPTLPEDEALSLIWMGVATKVQDHRKAQNAKKPKAAQPPADTRPASKAAVGGDAEPPAGQPGGISESVEAPAPEPEEEGENNG